MRVLRRRVQSVSGRGLRHDRQREVPQHMLSFLHAGAQPREQLLHRGLGQETFGSVLEVCGNFLETPGSTDAEPLSGAPHASSPMAGMHQPMPESLLKAAPGVFPHLMVTEPNILNWVFSALAIS